MRFPLTLPVSLLLSSLSLSIADITVTPDPTSNWGIWEGWGVSLAWWAKAFGNRDDLADIFFTNKQVNFNGRTLPGLAFNIARYNAGACSWNTIGSDRMVVSPSMIPSRQIEGFWVNWDSADAASSSWDWNVDANQRAMLVKARDRGANIFELFSNSPMWWMCKNHNPSGSDDASSDNLQSWNYEQHALYLATVAKRARDSWGINFQSVDPFNEPYTNYWSGKTGKQEGCHFDIGTQATVTGFMRSQLDRLGLQSIVVAASDETSYDQAVSTWNGIGATARGIIQRINVHGYQGGGGRRDSLYSLAKGAGKKLWNSEYGDNGADGKNMYTNMLVDFVWLHPTAWVYWQAIDITGWGLIVGDNDAKTLGTASTKYFVLAQLSRHIRPGMRILTGGNSDTVAAYDAAQKKLVIVAANWGAAQYINFDLSRFSNAGTSNGLIPRWSTRTSGGDTYVRRDDTYLSGKQFRSYFETNHIQTFELSGVSL
jgi:galactan endo-1,6-beta-galactosidase